MKGKQLITPSKRKMRHSKIRGLVAIAAVSILLSACSSSNKVAEPSPSGATAASGGFYTGAPVTIVLEGPNQFNNNNKTFGPEWDALVAAFHKTEPNITVKTIVQPLTSFYATTSTQLAAGTAPDLVFNQAKYTDPMVVPLNNYLKQPNPYIPGNKIWYDAYDHRYWGYTVPMSVSGGGKLNWIPFNLIGVGVFVNETIAAKADVSLPIKNMTELFSACSKIKAAGYTAFGWDNSYLPIMLEWPTLVDMMLRGTISDLNTYKADGTPGVNPAGMTNESIAKAILEGTLKASNPRIQAALTIFKRFMTTCATPNWSGVTNNNGAVTAYDEFAGGKAGMTWAVSFGLAALNKVKFKIQAQPFPLIDKAVSPLSPGLDARFGVSSGGTSYMIPSSTKGNKLAAAVKFLQFTASTASLKWMGTTGGISPLKGISSGVDLGANGEWGKPFFIATPANAPANTARSVFDGLFLGSKTLDETTAILQSNWNDWAKQMIKDNPTWQSESWAK